MKRDIDDEYLVKVLINIIAYSERSRRKNMTFLPQLQEITQKESIVFVKAECFPVSLRKFLNDRASIQNKGGRIVKAILEALLKVQSLDLVVRNISPNSIRVSHCLSKAMFTDMRRVCKDDETDMLKSLENVPYN